MGCFPQRHAHRGINSNSIQGSKFCRCFPSPSQRTNRLPVFQRVGIPSPAAAVRWSSSPAHDRSTFFQASSREALKRRAFPGAVKGGIPCELFTEQSVPGPRIQEGPAVSELFPSHPETRTPPVCLACFLKGTAFRRKSRS